MRCFACDKALTSKEISAASDEDFIDNKVFCSQDAQISKSLALQMQEEYNLSKETLKKVKKGLEDSAKGRISPRNWNKKI